VVVIAAFALCAKRQRRSSMPQRSAAPARSAELEGNEAAMKLHRIVVIEAADPLMAVVYALPREVFVVEQHIPQELEVDEDDKIATHVAALLEGRVIATLRFVADGQSVKIGRMAVAASFRKTGVGRTLMEFAEASAADRGFEKIVLGAQLTARDFYKRLGYVEEGPVFDDAGLPHVMMSKKLRA
jgi:predicted GNAT family N-acyltransferase